MLTVSYLLLDVFTDTPFSGNQLAVVLDAPHLTAERRQLVAGELNLSETVFLSETSNGWTTRIHTPTTELPFAGHPTIGAALALVHAGRATDAVTLHEPVGPIEVTITQGWAELKTAIPPSSIPCADPDDVVGAIGLTMSDLHHDLGPRGWSAGVPFTVVAVRDVETLGRCEVDVARWREGVALTTPDQLYVLAPVDGRASGKSWRARMFAPGFGIPEDPATGSAAAAACGYLAAHAGDALEEGWVIHQGVEMGRPSEIRVRPVLTGPELTAAAVAGQACVIGRGELHLPG